MKIFRLLIIVFVVIVNVSLPVYGENNISNVGEYNKVIETYKAVLQNEKKLNPLCFSARPASIHMAGNILG